MTLNFPFTDNRDQVRRDEELKRADAENFKRNQPVELQPGVPLILHSPNGTRYVVTVDDTGVLGTVVA